jgi:hypothetical protein
MKSPSRILDRLDLMRRRVSMSQKKKEQTTKMMDSKAMIQRDDSSWIKDHGPAGRGRAANGPFGFEEA